MNTPEYNNTTAEQVLYLNKTKITGKFLHSKNSLLQYIDN